jgi:diguanylate cyclase (GGDEF)-like protein/PAS domain S-box-containing protein
MNLVLVFYSTACLATAIVSLVVAHFCWNRRETPSATPLAWLMLAFAEWAVANAFEALVTTVPLKVFWSQVSYFGISTAPVFFLLFALAYSQQFKWLTRRTVGVLFVIPTITLAMAWTNEWHHLLWSQFTFSPLQDNILVYGRGPWFGVSIIYTYAMLTLGTWLLIQSFVRLEGVYRRQAGGLLIGVAVSVFWNVLYLLNLSPIPSLDLTPMAFSLSGWIIAWNIFRLHLFDLAPIARDVLIENMNDAVLVIDAQDRIVDMNPAAQRLVGQKRADVLGKSAAQVWRPWHDLMAHRRNLRQAQIEIAATPSSPQHLDVRLTALQNHHGQIIGRLAIARDITDRKQAEQEIRQHLVELSTINDVSQMVTSQTNLDLMLQTIGDKVRQLLNAHGVFISLYDAQTQIINIPYWRYYDEFISAPPMPLGKGLTSVIIRSRRPLLINQDYERQSADLGVVYFNVPGRSRPRAWLGVPMIVGDQVIGVIAAQNYESENAFTDSDLRLWTTIAANVGIAIRNAQLFSEMRQYTEQLTAINRINVAITEGLAMEKLLPTLHEQCRQIAPVDVFFVAQYSEATHRLTLVYFFEHGATYVIPPRDIRQDPSLAGYIINTRQTLYLPDTLDPARLPPVKLTRVGGIPARSFLGVPLIVRNHVVGVISMQSYQPCAYSPQQIETLEHIAVQAAIALQNSQLYEEVQQLAATDELTGLPNRRVLFERGRDEINRAQRFNHPLAVAMLDIDHFKIVNDTYTHAAGDHVLQAIAQMCKAQLRNTDLAARYGGEEFALLLPETDSAAAIQVVERLCQVLAETDIALGQEITTRVTVSAGIAMFDATTDSFDALIQRADQALYRAKHSGRNRVILWTGDTQ